MGGLELIDELVEFDLFCFIIVIIGYGNVELVKWILIKGVFDFIEKFVIVVEDLVLVV